eukprot:COSAG05_NODE_1238_length_5430_cov_48.807728_3_plen_44_part_00
MDRESMGGKFAAAARVSVAETPASSQNVLYLQYVRVRLKIDNP